MMKHIFLLFSPLILFSGLVYAAPSAGTLSLSYNSTNDNYEVVLNVTAVNSFPNSNLGASQVSIVVPNFITQGDINVSGWDINPGGFNSLNASQNVATISTGGANLGNAGIGAISLFTFSLGSGCEESIRFFSNGEGSSRFNNDIVFIPLSFTITGTSENISCPTLPIELTSFTAQPHTNNTSLLLWETAAELNNDYFDIEHSYDGAEFTKIGYLNGQGTTSETHSYEYTHQTPVQGANYYRLKQVDINGAFKYSNIEVVNFEGGQIAKRVNIFPNPANDYLTISALTTANRQSVDLEIYDAQGRIVLQKQYDVFNRTNRLDISGLTSGQFTIKLNMDGQVLLERFVVTR